MSLEEGVDKKARTGVWATVHTALRYVCGGREDWAGVAAEAVGSALLVSLSCAAPDRPLHLQAVQTGLIVAMLIQCFDHISLALLSPAVTLAACLRGRLPPARALRWVVAQLAGGMVAAACLSPESCRLCATVPGPGVTHYQALSVEFICAFSLCAASCAAWDARNSGLRDSWPLRAGLAVTALILCAGHISGASMNPARSLALGARAGVWTACWVYWLGPLSGAAAAACLYSTLWAPPPARPPPPAPGPAAELLVHKDSSL